MAAQPSALQEKPPRPAAPGKKWIQVPKVVNGIETSEWMEVDEAAAAGPRWPARGDLEVLNKDIPRVDGPEKVSGRARFTHDVRLPGMVYARLLLCPYAAAKVTLDLEPAKKVPGVVDVRATRNHSDVDMLGQPLAAVSAETPEAAEDGLRAIGVEYETQPFAVTYEQALADGAPRISERGNVREERKVGDESEAKAALAQCDAVVEATYSLPVQHHACLETHGWVVDYRGGDSATVYASTQGTFIVQEDAASLLGLPQGQVTCEVPYMGGGFGSKFEPGSEGSLACAIAKDLKRPVHLMLTRRDEFLIAGNRSGAVQRLKGGATKDGQLAVLMAEVDKLGGRGRGSHPGLPYIYAPRTSFLRLRAVHTSTDPSRAFRAPGHPQASFAMESMMDELAYAIGMDPLEFRKRNLPEGRRAAYVRQLDRCAQEIGWSEHAHRTAPDRGSGPLKVGIGFGLSTWGGGGGKQCVVEVRIARDGAVTVLSGTQDLGTGTRTYVAAIVAEEFGLPVSAVTARIGSSQYGAANPSGGSQTTASLAPAVKDAAFNARAKLAEHLSKELRANAEGLSFGGAAVREASSGKRWSWEEACATLPPSGLSATGEWQESLAGNGVHGAQAAQVEVDVRTGGIRVVKMVCVQDCGLPLNRLALKSQIQGGMVQALSYGLFEERVIDPDIGVALNANFEDYKLAGSQEMPEMVALVDDGDSRNAVIGMAEPAVIPGHATLANAIHNACGVRLREMPLTSDKLLTALRKLG